jgi:proteasome lid subunit RPN8/RPN11
VPNLIRIESNVLHQVQSHARREPERECCGLLAGCHGVITRAYPALNAAAHPAKEYEIAAEELFQLMREIRDAGLQMLGIYHSHPNGLQEPSPRDIELAYYPGAVYFIISMKAGAEQIVRAFSIHGPEVSELRIEIVD